MSTLLDQASFDFPFLKLCEGTRYGDDLDAIPRGVDPYITHILIPHGVESLQLFGPVSRLILRDICKRESQTKSERMMSTKHVHTHTHP